MLKKELEEKANSILEIVKMRKKNLVKKEV